MKPEKNGTRIFRFRLTALAILVALGFWNISIARAQFDNGLPDPASAQAADQPDQDSAENPDGTQQASDAADAAQDALDSATEARDQLESDGASQDQIDAANAAIAQARANKDAADAAVQNAGAQ